MNRSLSFALSALIVAFSVSAASAITLPTIEDFDTGPANWRQATSSLTVDWAADGGPEGDGDAYVTYNRSVGTATAAAVVFRGQGAFDSSADAFVGDWLAAGVKEFSFWFRHDAPGPVTVGARFTPAATNFPAMSILTPVNSVAPNAWTQITFSLALDNPNWINESADPIATTYNTVFSDLANVQIMLQRDDSIPNNTVVKIDLDKVAALPEPSSFALASLGIVGAAFVARRRKAAR